MKSKLLKRGIRSAEDVIDILRSKSTARSLTARTGEINKDDRTVVLTYSSEEPVLRWFGWEVLSHKRGAQNLKRLNAGAPLLDNHDPDKRLGAIMEAKVEEGRGAAVVKFSRSQRGEEAFQDVQDGILNNASFRYVYDDVELVEKGEDREDGIDVYHVRSYTSLEVSLVSIPADISVGVGRSNGDGFDDINAQYETEDTETEPENERQQEQTEEEVMKNKNGQNPGTGENSSSGNGSRIEGGGDRSAEILEMFDIAEKFGHKDLAKKFVQEGRSLDDFSREMLKKMNGPGEGHKNMSDEVNMSANEKRQYSFLNALRAAAFNDWRGAELERDVSQRMSEVLKRETHGFFAPTDLLRSTATSPAMTVAGQGSGDLSGGAFVETDLLVGSFIDLLQNKLVVKRLGAQVLTGLRGNIAIPKQTGGATAYWVRERENVPGSKATTGQIPMSPKTIGAITDLSRKLLLQSSVSVNNFVINDITRSLAREIERAIIFGRALDEQNEPTGMPNGILATSGTTSVALGANGGRLSYPKVIELETIVSSKNADSGSLAYLSNSKVRGALKTTKKAEGESGFVWEGMLPDGDGIVNGSRFAITNMIPSNLTKGTRNDLSALIYGAWSDLVLGEWGVIETLVNPYGPGSDNGDVRIRVLQDLDFILRHGESFAYSLDVQT